jgi:hypothetical protein
MTNKEWETEIRRPQAMMWTLRTQRVPRTKIGKRRLRLFACACCRQVWDLLDDPHRHAVDVAERFADGLATRVELESAGTELNGISTGGFSP